MYCKHRQLKSHHAAVLINLCIALIIANVIFLIGSNQVNNTVSYVTSLSFTYCSFYS